MQPAQPQFTKAKSRLLEAKKPPIPPEASYKPRLIPSKSIPVSPKSTPISVTARAPLKKNNAAISAIWIKRAKFLPLLFLGLIGYGILFHIMTAIDPAQIANVLFYESYLPLHIVFLVSNFFLLSFIFLHSRRAVVWSVFFAVLLFFKLQAVAFTISTLLIVFLIFVFIEALFTFIFKK